MKLKYYLRGIGIGVFFSTIIFMVSISIHKDELTQKASATEEVTAETVADLQEKESETQANDRNSEMQIDESESKADSETQVTEMEDTQVSDTETIEETDNEKTDGNEVEIVTIQVDAGEFSDEICRKLKDKGLVEDAWDFNVYLMEIDFDNLIRPGEYEIPKGSTYEEIAQLLVPNRKN